MSNKKLENGLNGLLTLPTEQERMEEQEPKQKTETVCWNLNPADIENVKMIAKYEGKRVNAVVTEALRLYFSQWVPVPQEAPKLKL